MIRAAHGKTRKKIQRIILAVYRRYGWVPSALEVRTMLGGDIAPQVVRKHMTELAARGFISAVTGSSRRRRLLTPEGRLLEKIRALVFCDPEEAADVAASHGLPAWVSPVLKNLLRRP